jgi:hypothetical protein
MKNKSILTILKERMEETRKKFESREITNPFFKRLMENNPNITIIKSANFNKVESSLLKRLKENAMKIKETTIIKEK